MKTFNSYNQILTSEEQVCIFNYGFLYIFDTDKFAVWKRNSRILSACALLVTPCFVIPGGKRGFASKIFTIFGKQKKSQFSFRFFPSLSYPSTCFLFRFSETTEDCGEGCEYSLTGEHTIYDTVVRKCFICIFIFCRTTRTGISRGLL